MGLFSRLFSKEGEEAQEQSEIADETAAVPGKSDDEPDADSDTGEFTAQTQKPPDMPTHRGPPAAPGPPARVAAPPVLMPRTVARKGLGPGRAPPPPAGTESAGRTPAPTTGVMSAPTAVRRASPPPPVPKAAPAGTQKGKRESPPPALPTDKRSTGNDQSKNARRKPPRANPLPPARGRPAAEGRPGVHRGDPEPAVVPARSATAKGSAAVSSNGSTKRARIDVDHDGAVDAAVDALQSLPSADDREPTKPALDDARAVTEMFAAVAGAHTQPVSDFMAQLAMGATPSSWAAPLRSVVAPLLDAARQMELEDMVAGFNAFDTALARAAAERSPHISRAVRDELEQAYRQMVAQQPDTFRVSGDGDGRGRILLEALLLQIPSFHRRTLARLYAAGLQDLEQLIAASPEEVAQVAGIEGSLAVAIAQRLDRFNRERARAEPVALRSLIYGQLRAAVECLSKLHVEFERAREAEVARQKRTARRGLQTSVLELDALLAQLGELTLVEELKRMPVHHKIARVQSYLEQAQAA